MNFYVSLINDAIEYIEDNIYENISLGDISQRFCVSEFHFNRMFKTVTGWTLKQYILGRKLSRASECLSTTNESVINIAYDFGFANPEVFSRDFKKQFGTSPNTFRKDKPKLQPVNKVSIVERDIINYQGNMTLKGTGVFLTELQLKGIQIDVDINKARFKQELQTSGAAFLMEAQKIGGLSKDRLYSVVNCHGEDNGEYTVFYGMEAEYSINGKGLEARLVPEGWYEKFLYSGDMFDIRERFTDDLYRWMIVKEVELEYNGIGMLSIFQKDYPYTRQVEILVPVKNPMQIAKKVMKQ